MSRTKVSRIRYRVEHTTNRNGEWFPKFFPTLEAAIDLVLSYGNNSREE